MYKNLLAIICTFILMLNPLTTNAEHPQLLQQHDKISVEMALIDEFPNLNIKSLTLITSGWDNLVAEINGEWIFRFPRKEVFLSILEREHLLLDRLRLSISIQVPNYEFIGVKTAFVGYRKIPGDNLEEELYLTLTNEVRQEIAETLASFLSQLHRCVSVEEARQWGYLDYHLPLQKIEQSLISTLPNREMRRIAKEALVYAKQHPCRTEHLVLTHNDLHGGNLAFDSNTKKIAGVFDFSDAAIGDYSIDFGKLFCIDPDVAIRTAAAYSLMNNCPDPTIPAAADFILRRVYYILLNRETGNTFYDERLLLMLDRFIPVWDKLTEGKISSDGIKSGI